MALNREDAASTLLFRNPRQNLRPFSVYLCRRACSREKESYVPPYRTCARFCFIRFLTTIPVTQFSSTEHKSTVLAIMLRCEWDCEWACSGENVGLESSASIGSYSLSQHSFIVRTRDEYNLEWWELRVNLRYSWNSRSEWGKKSTLNDARTERTDVMCTQVCTVQQPHKFTVFFGYSNKHWWKKHSGRFTKCKRDEKLERLNENDGVWPFKQNCDRFTTANDVAWDCNVIWSTGTQVPFVFLGTTALYTTPPLASIHFHNVRDRSERWFSFRINGSCVQ